MEKLTHVEEETMQAVWRTGEGNVKAFMENMDEPAPYTTVASTVKNLEKKKIPDQQIDWKCLLV